MSAKAVSLPKLTEEQDIFLRDVMKGRNVLVDACVGSGKTTAIQALCNAVPTSKKILYLTYSKLLKIDAQAKILNRNTTVQNYHGFAYKYARVAPQEQIKQFLLMSPKIEHYDLLVLDEYQDIDQEIADMLTYIKNKLPNLQVVAVGDMQQKIQDKTMLDVSGFMVDFLGKFYAKRTFTTCFRLNKSHAEMLGRVWKKSIVGVNQSCVIKHMTEDEVFNLLLDSEPSDILCLGSRTGRMYKLLDDLEDSASYKFNKNTVYASIRDKDSRQPALSSDVAIFTTFDSCKGLERKTCVVFDFDNNYWSARLNKPDQSGEILRNIFCVAASRGKDRIVFVKGRGTLLNEEELSTCKLTSLEVTNYSISEMFDFKRNEDVDKCFKYLKIQEITDTNNSFALDIKRTDGLIDLSPCIGIFQEADFFESYNIDTAVRHAIYGCGTEKENLITSKHIWSQWYKTCGTLSLEEKVLFLTSLETKLERYRTQVKTPFIKENDRKLISERISSHFSPTEKVQKSCKLPFFISDTKKRNSDELNRPCFHAVGMADVVKDDIVYELKFVSHVDTAHFLQLACYVVALGLKKGKLINILDNRIYEVTVSKRLQFLEAVAHTITKQRFSDYKIRVGKKANSEIIKYWDTERKKREEKKQQQKEMIAARRFKLTELCEVADGNAEMFALIDVETTYSDKVVSIGVVISDDISFKARNFKYFIIKERANTPAMYSHALDLSQFLLNSKEHETKVKYLDAIDSIKKLLSVNSVKRLFAYNANFDKNHLPELNTYHWHDIIEKAAYKQTNKKIPADSDFYGTGRLKKGYGVESMYRLLADDVNYIETHNALIDALDELKIMEFLKFRVAQYTILK